MKPKKGALLIKATQGDSNPESRYPTCNMWQFLLAVLEKVDNANWVLPTSIKTKEKCMCTVKKICACIWDKCDQGEEANCVLIIASAMSWDKTNNHFRHKHKHREVPCIVYRDHKIWVYHTNILWSQIYKLA